MGVLDERDDIWAERDVAELVVLPVGLQQILLNILQFVEPHHRVHHHVLWRGEGQLLSKELAQYLGRRHPSELIELVVALYDRVALVQVFLVLCVFQEVYELQVLHLVQEESRVVSNGQLWNSNKAQEWSDVCPGREYCA